MKTLKEILLDNCVKLDEKRTLNLFVDNVCKIMDTEWKNAEALSHITAIKTSIGTVYFSGLTIEIKTDKGTFCSKINATNEYKYYITCLRNEILENMFKEEPVTSSTEDIFGDEPEEILDESNYNHEG
jgi:hypothetical protein